SNSRLPAPRITGAVEMTSSSTFLPRQRLPDDVGAATDGDIAVPGRLSRLRERRVKVRDEPEPGLRRRLVRGPVGEHEQSPGEGVGPTPRAGRVVHATADHARRHRRDELVVELL